MSTLLDRIATKQAKKQLATFGQTATLESRSGNVSATAIKISPPQRKRVFMPDSRIEEEVSEVYVAAQDPALLAVSFPSPRPGDLLTVRSRVVTLAEGTGAVDSGQDIALYRLVYRG